MKPEMKPPAGESSVAVNLTVNDVFQAACEVGVPISFGDAMRLLMNHDLTDEIRRNMRDVGREFIGYVLLHKTRGSTWEEKCEEAQAQALEGQYDG